MMTAAGRFDTIPSDVWERVAQVMRQRSISLNRLRVAVGSTSRGDLNADICPTRSRIGRIAETMCSGTPSYLSKVWGISQFMMRR
jgi:hypothetical protein